jgi:tetratricopeptide (TPR) repeat protein
LRATLYCLTLFPLLTLSPLFARPALAADVSAPPASGAAPSGAVPSGLAAEAPSAPSAAETANARPANVVEAEHLAAQAFDAYERKEYRQAIELYQRALDAASSADILYNIARVYDVGLHDSARASEYYRRYLAEPKVQSPRRQLAEQRVAALQPPPLSAAIETDPAAAIADTAPLQPSSSWTWRETSAVALAGSGVIALGIGAGFAISAASQSDTWKQDCDGNVCQSQRGVDAAHTAADRAGVATIALAAGGALLAGGAAIWFLGTKHEESPRVALQVVPTGPAAQVGCSFSSSF